tara:strand:+ start:129 stop:449 length:321 start_codon:yes stop_codon:yes gene_type:complete
MARPKGSKNKLNKSIKDAVEHSFHKLPGGASAYLLELAKTDPKTYAGLLARLIPTQQTIDTNMTIDLGHALIDASKRLEAMSSPHDITPNTLIIDNADENDNETIG